MNWEQIYQNTFIPELPKIWNRNFQTFQNYMNVFYDASRGIIIKPVVTTGKVKAASGEFVTLITDNLIVKGSSNAIGGVPTDELTLSKGLVLDSSTLNYIYKADVSVNTNEGEIVPPLTITGARNIHPRGDFTTIYTSTTYPTSPYTYTTTYEKLSTGGPLVLSGGNTVDGSIGENGQGGDLILQGGTLPGFEQNLGTFGDVLVKGDNITLESNMLFISEHISAKDAADRYISMGVGTNSSLDIFNYNYGIEIDEKGVTFNELAESAFFEIKGNSLPELFKVNGVWNRMYFGESNTIPDRSNSSFENYYTQVATIESRAFWGVSGEGLSDSVTHMDSLHLKNLGSGVGVGRIGGSLSLSGPYDIVGGKSVRQTVIAGKQTGSLASEVGIAMYTHNDASTNIIESLVLDHQSNLTILGSYFPSSDIRLKDSLETIENPLEKIKKLTGYTFNKGGTRQAGLIADDVLAVLPEAIQIDVTKDKYLHLNDSAVTGLLVEALKEQMKLIEAQGELIKELQLKIK